MIRLSEDYVREKIENQDVHGVFLKRDQQIRFLIARDYDSKKA